MIMNLDGREYNGLFLACFSFLFWILVLWFQFLVCIPYSNYMYWDIGAYSVHGAPMHQKGESR